MSRLKPCMPENNNEKVENLSNETINLSNETINLSNETINLSNETINLSNETNNLSNETNNRCEFCLNIFFSKYTKNKHQLNCKDRNDPIRNLEIEKGIKPPIAICKTECRFCNHDFFNTSSLHRHFNVCKKRENYFNQLKEIQPQQNIQTQINNINNFNAPVSNNITINLIGNESTSHIDIQKIINNLRMLNGNYGDKHIYLQAGEMVVNFDEILREVPENQNMYLPNERSIYTEEKIETGWEKKEREQSLNKYFKNSAKLLYDSKESIDTINKKVFKQKSNIKVFDEVKQFSEKGFEHENAVSGEFYQGEQKLIRSKYKIGRLKNRITGF